MHSFFYRRLLFCQTIFLLIANTNSLFGFTKTGTIYTTDGSQSDVTAAITNSSTGDTVLIPAGSFTWGASNTAIAVNKAITLAGAGTTNTTIVMASTGPTIANGVIRITAPATVRDFTVIPAANVAPFACNAANGWRITNITYNPSGSAVAYFCYAGSYGLIDSCNITGAGGNNELIFTRGPSNSWQTPSSMGTDNTLFIENCTFNGPGYVCDMNSNARGVVRFCTINGQMKVDGHGVASNSPARSVRHMEVYGNTWTTASGFTAAIEIRGGTGFLFDNISINRTAGQLWLYLHDYGYTAQWPNFGNTYQTPTNYPVKDQIGVGMDPKAAASEPMYLWNNRATGADWYLTTKIIPAAAIDLYRAQSGNPAATYVMQDVISADRDYFKDVASFNGSTGVGRGTKAQMLAITPTKTGVGFWVTDEADWNSLVAGNDGQLYVWNGSSWVLRYTPYVYPHPLTTGVPQPPQPPPVVTAPSNAKVGITVQ